MWPCPLPSPLQPWRDKGANVVSAVEGELCHGAHGGAAAPRPQAVLCVCCLVGAPQLGADTQSVRRQLHVACPVLPRAEEADPSALCQAVGGHGSQVHASSQGLPVIPRCYQARNLLFQGDYRGGSRRQHGAQELRPRPRRGGPSPLLIHHIVLPSPSP